MNCKLIRYTEDEVQRYLRFNHSVATKVEIDDERIVVNLYELLEDGQENLVFFGVALYGDKKLSLLSSEKKEYMVKQITKNITGSIEIGILDDYERVIDLNKIIEGSAEFLRMWILEQLNYDPFSDCPI